MCIRDRQYSFPCLLFSYEREMLRCNLRFCFSSFLTFFALLMFLYLLPSEHIAKSLIPKSIPIPSLDGTVTESSYSMPTVIHQLIPSYPVSYTHLDVYKRQVTLPVLCRPEDLLTEKPVFFRF